jgi:hypothetical protein
MKKFLGYTTIFVLLGILFFSFNNMFVEQEKEVIVEKETEQITLANIYLVKLINRLEYLLCISYGKKVCWIMLLLVV